MATKVAPVIRKMTRARMAIFERHPWTLGERAGKHWIERNHEELERNFDQLLTWYDRSTDIGAILNYDPLPFIGDREYDGNLILEDMLKRNGPDKELEVMQKMAARSEARSKYAGEFFDTFKVSISKYWIDNRSGFDATRFDAEIVKSPDNLSVYEAIRRRWGDNSVKIIEAIMI